MDMPCRRVSENMFSLLFVLSDSTVVGSVRNDFVQHR